MSLLTLLPFIVLIGAMFLMTRSAKKKQQQAADMRNQMQPGSGIRTIGGIYATVKEVNEDTVLVDAGPGVELLFAKNAIGAVLSDDEYNRIVHGIEHDLKSDADIVPDDASSLTESDASAADAGDDDKAVDLGKKDAADEPADGDPGRRGEDGRRAEEDRRRLRGEVVVSRGARARRAHPGTRPARTESRHHVMAARPPIRSEVAREGVREGGHT